VKCVKFSTHFPTVQFFSSSRGKSKPLNSGETRRIFWRSNETSGFLERPRMFPAQTRSRRYDDRMRFSECARTIAIKYISQKEKKKKTKSLFIDASRYPVATKRDSYGANYSRESSNICDTCFRIFPFLCLSHSSVRARARIFFSPTPGVSANGTVSRTREIAP